MLDRSGLLTQLEEHAARFDLIERANRGFTACFANARGGTIDGWTAAELRVEFHSHKLAFAHALPPFIETRLTLRKLDGCLMGHYTLITDLEGEATDDYLVFY